MARSEMPHRDRLNSLGTTARKKRLLLFDIDGTLIHSGGAGIHALIVAFKERFGITDDLHDIEIAGMTDSGIVSAYLTSIRFLQLTKISAAFWIVTSISFRRNFPAERATCSPACWNYSRD